MKNLSTVIAIVGLFILASQWVLFDGHLNDQWTREQVKIFSKEDESNEIKKE